MLVTIMKSINNTWTERAAANKALVTYSFDASEHLGHLLCARVFSNMGCHYFSKIKPKNGKLYIFLPHFANRNKSSRDVNVTKVL